MVLFGTCASGRRKGLVAAIAPVDGVTGHRLLVCSTRRANRQVVCDALVDLIRTRKPRPNIGQRQAGPRALDRAALAPAPRAHHAVGVAAVGGRDRVKQNARRTVQLAVDGAALKRERHREPVARVDRQTGDVMVHQIGEGQRALRRVELDEIEVAVCWIERKHVTVHGRHIAPGHQPQLGG